MHRMTSIHNRRRHSAPRRSAGRLIVLVGCVTGLVLVALAASALLTGGNRATRALLQEPSRRSGGTVASRLVVADKTKQASSTSGTASARGLEGGFVRTDRGRAIPALESHDTS